MLQSVTVSGSNAAAEDGVKSEPGCDDVRQLGKAATGAAGRDVLSAGRTFLTQPCGMQCQPLALRKAVCIVRPFLS